MQANKHRQKHCRVAESFEVYRYTCHLPVYRGRAVLPFRNEVSQFFGSCTVANRSFHFSKKAELPVGQHVQVDFGTPRQIQCGAFVVHSDDSHRG